MQGFQGIIGIILLVATTTRIGAKALVSGYLNKANTGMQILIIFTIMFLSYQLIGKICSVVYSYVTKIQILWTKRI